MKSDESRWKDISELDLPPVERHGFESNVLKRRIWEEPNVEESNADESVKVYLIRLSNNERIDIKGNSLVMGKGDSADYMIENNRAISRIHAAITGKGAEFFLEDLDSLNHTYLNEEKITKKTKLADGDLIKLADEEFIFLFE